MGGNGIQEFSLSLFYSLAPTGEPNGHTSASLGSFPKREDGTHASVTEIYTHFALEKKGKKKVDVITLCTASVLGGYN